jgi:hypothetical protein
MTAVISAGRAFAQMQRKAHSTRSRLKACALALGFWTLLALASALSAGLAEISDGNWLRQHRG